MEKVPRHIAIILDGNRRFSKRLMIKPWMGHEWGAKKVEQLLEWCKELDVQELTLYVFSIQNFSRPKEEFDFLMDLFKKEFMRIIDDERIMKDGLKINFIGRLSMFPKDLQACFNGLMKRTENNDRRTVNFAMAYGGREEVIDGIKKLAKDIGSGKLEPTDIDEDKFRGYLYIQSEPDMIIRTGGEKRLSNFLMWQSPYTELFFIDKTWPEFEKIDLVESIEEYRNRDRRFGK